MPMSQDTSTESKETEKTQLVATGSIAGVDHTKVEAEAAANGVSLDPIGGHGQGGEGH